MSNSHERRRANKEEHPAEGLRGNDIDLNDPNLAPEDRDGFINAIKGEGRAVG
jgi:hypothetical protein